MSNKTLYKIAGISGWLLLVMLVLYFISGYAMVREYGMDVLMSNAHAWHWHKYLTIPFFVFLVLHIVPYYVIRKQVKRLLIIAVVVVSLPILGVYAIDNLHYKKAEPPTKQVQQENKEITCPNCPMGCKLKPGEVGECGQFMNKDGKIQKISK